MKNKLFMTVMGVCALWWAYLFFTTQVVIVFDSVGYEDLGNMIYHQGWGKFFQGLQREPMFPALVAAAMQIGDWLKVEYAYPLKVMGIACLAVTMVFMYLIMQRLSINRWVSAGVLAYMGLSPVVTNSCMRVWSEFAAYPWVVIAVWWTIKCFQDIALSEGRKISPLHASGAGIALALLFILIMSVKAVAEAVLLVYLWPFYLSAWQAWRRKNNIQLRALLIFVVSVVVVFEGIVSGYKFINYKHNGHYAFTNRGDWALYGNTVRRMEPLSIKSLGAAIAFTPGMGICEKYFGAPACEFWSARHSDDIIGQKQTELTAKGYSEEQSSKYFISGSIKAVLSNPFQALLLMVVEAHKMFFWESSFAFVAYPNWMDNILYVPAFSNTIRTLMAVFTWVGFIFGLIYLCRRCCRMGTRDWTLFWVFNFAACYMGIYSLFFVLDRYAFPLISLYMVLSAFAVDWLIKKYVSRNK